MIRKIFYCLIIILFVEANVQAQQIRKVLFLGNSYTYTNNLPQIISDLASSLGDSLIFDSYTPGGYTLTQHLSDSTGLHKIMQGGWDYVVLQEQSQLPSFDAYSTYAAQELCNIISEYNPCARKLYYMTWGRKHGDAGNCAAWPPSCTYEGMDSTIRETYLYTASITNAEVSPVGPVWRNIITNFPAIELYNPDESHPSEAGSFAGACSFYSMLFRRNPALSNYNYTLSSTDAAIIRDAAKAVAFDSLQNWDLGDYNPVADFNYYIGHGMNEVYFVNQSTNYDSFLWEFGDGDTSTTKHPVHSYALNGIYHATLTAYNCDLLQPNQSVYQRDISFCSFTPSVIPDSLFICPNTSDTLSTQVYDSYQWLDYYGDTLPGETSQFLIPPSGGYYSVIVTQNNCAEITPFSYVEIYSGSFIIFHVDTFSNAASLDSICNGDTIMLVLATNKPAGPVLIYQWLNNGVEIPGANDDTLYVTTSGNYYVKVNHTGCLLYSFYESPLQSITFLNCNIGIDENDARSSVQIFPNPARDQLFVRTDVNFSNAEYIIVDIYGRIVSNGKLNNQLSSISLNGFARGIYFIEIPGMIKSKFIKD